MINSWSASFYQLLNQWGYSHPVHPALVHLPIGLVGGAFIFGWLALLFNREQLAHSARHCLILAFLFWFPVALFGFFDWQHFYGGAWLYPIKVKLVLSGTLLVLFLTALIFGYKKKNSARTAITVYTLSMVTVVFLGFFGSQLVYGGKTIKESKTSQAGEKIFAAKCLTCHPRGENLIRPKKPIRNSVKLKDLDTFISWIRHPIAPMPTFSDSEISVSQARDLYSYITEVLTEKQARGEGRREKNKFGA